MPIACLCHGIEILAAADCIEGKRVTTVPKCALDAAQGRATYVDEDVVVDGLLVTGRAGSAITAEIGAMKSTEQLDEAFHLLAWGRLINGEPREAQQALTSMSGERTADPALEGAVLVELGRPADAMPLLEEARGRGGSFAEAYYQRALREKNA